MFFPYIPSCEAHKQFGAKPAQYGLEINFKFSKKGKILALNVSHLSIPSFFNLRMYEIGHQQTCIPGPAYLSVCIKLYKKTDLRVRILKT